MQTGQLGGNIFNIPTVGAYAYQANTGTAGMTATVEPGKGSELPASDFIIIYTSATSVSIQPVDNKGEPLGDPSVADIPADGIINRRRYSKCSPLSSGKQLQHQKC